MRGVGVGASRFQIGAQGIAKGSAVIVTFEGP